jgi:hypothetical protein
MALGPRAFVALLFGAWAGWRGLRGRRALNAFLLIEAPWLLSLGVIAILPFFFTPGDPAKWPVLGAVLGLHLLDLVTL